MQVGDIKMLATLLVAPTQYSVVQERLFFLRNSCLLEFMVHQSLWYGQVILSAISSLRDFTWNVEYVCHQHAEGKPAASGVSHCKKGIKAKMCHT